MKRIFLTESTHAFDVRLYHTLRCRLPRSFVLHSVFVGVVSLAKLVFPGTHRGNGASAEHLMNWALFE